MMRNAVLAVALVAALCACKPAPDKAAPGGSATSGAPAAPVQAAGDWFVTMAPDNQMLDFKANIDAATSDLNLACTPGSNALSMAWGNAEPATLSSGGATETYAAHDAAAKLDDPVFAALRESGVIEITQGGVKKTLRGSPDGRFAVRAFFQFCNKPIQ